MKKSEFTCDCGCKKKASHVKGWFLVSQHYRPSDDYAVKLRRKLHFASLECILRWSKPAAKMGAALHKQASESPRPRGTFSDKDTFIYV